MDAIMDAGTITTSWPLRLRKRSVLLGDRKDYKQKRAL